MTAAPYFHIGFLVHDLDAAMERFAEVFGVTWTGRTTTRSRFWEAGVGTIDLELDVVYSVEGPPHIELVQSAGNGLYAAGRAEGFHHIGAWSRDLAASTGRDDGPPLERIAAQFNAANQLIAAHYDPTQLHGVLLEVIDESRREMMEGWLEGGPFVD